MDDFFSDDETTIGAGSALLSGSRADEDEDAQTTVDARMAASQPGATEVVIGETTIDFSDPITAIEQLHAAYASRLLAYASSMLRNREDAEDAVQTTFMNVYNSLVDGRVPRQEVSWLFRITRNVCLNRIRTHQRKPAGSLEGIDVASHRGVEDQLDQHLHALALRAALERLPEQQRKAIVLRELQGASYNEIADALDTTQGAVESLIFRARRQLATSIRAATPAVERLAAQAA